LGCIIDVDTAAVVFGLCTTTSMGKAVERTACVTL